MKNTLTKFDLTAAFKALDDLNYSKSKPELNGRNRNLAESIQSAANKSLTETLLEDYYNLEDRDDLENATKDRTDEIAQAKLARIEKIVDLDAKTVDDLLPSYVGKVIMQCPQCMTLFYKNEEDIEKDPKDPTTCNINEPCQHCGNISGYTLIGKVDAVETEPVKTKTTEEPLETQEETTGQEKISKEETDKEPKEKEEASEETSDKKIKSDEENLDLDLDLESLNNSVKATLVEDINNEEEDDPNIIITESKDTANETDYYNSFLKDACYYINKEGYFDLYGSNITQKANDIIAAFDSEVAGYRKGKAAKAGATSADLEIIDLEDNGKRIQIKGINIDECLSEGVESTLKAFAASLDSIPVNTDVDEETLRESSLQDLTDKTVAKLKALQNSDEIVEENLTEADDSEVSNADFKKMINSKVFKDFAPTTEGLTEHLIVESSLQDLTDKTVAKLKALQNSDEIVEENLTEADDSSINNIKQKLNDCIDSLDEAVAITIGVDEIDDKVAADTTCDTMVVSKPEATAIYEKPVEKCTDVNQLACSKETDNDSNFYDNLDELDDETIEECINNSLKEVYENVANFKFTNCQLDKDKLVVEGLINFTSGRKKPTKYVFTEAKVRNNKVKLIGINESLAKNGKFSIIGYIANNSKLIAENMTYRYKINDTLVEGLIRTSK